MNTTGQIAKHLRDVYFGGNWTASNLKDNLADVTWQQATMQVHSFNTIAALVYHINYYINTVMKYMQGELLTAKDIYSFDHPPVRSAEDWEKLLNRCSEEATEFAGLIEQMPEERLWEIFADEKYGTYYRNFHGIIEHAHYHLGQIVLIKKLIAQMDKPGIK